MPKLLNPRSSTSFGAYLIAGIIYPKFSQKDKFQASRLEPG
jgi:hypothetical protein